MKTYNNEDIEVQDLKRPKEFSVTEIIGLKGNPEATKHSSFYKQDTETYRGGVTWPRSPAY